MKNLFTLVLLTLICYKANSQGLVISQVYGAGGNASATYNADFVEIFNPTTAPVNLSGYSVQYASATGTSWQKFDLPATTLVSGQYFLVQMSTPGATGVALPTPDATASPAIAMSGTAGKVALVNSTTALSGTQCPPPFVAGIVDFVGFGTTANCFEGTGPTPAPGSNANSLTRLANGCTDNNDNAADFVALVAAARNTSTSLNPCGSPVPTLVAGPNINNLTTSVGTASAPQTFTLSGYNLTGFPGNISVTASANLEVSLSGASGYAGSINVPYTTATLSPTTIYVRISAAAPQGAVSGTVTNSGGGAASNAVVTVNGGVYQNYYNTKANLGLNNTGTWSTTTNGSGPSPANFTNPYQLFNIISQANANYTGEWDVTGAGNSSRVIVGDGTAPLTFTILPGADSVTSATRIDVLNNATLVIQNNRRPFLNNLATGSTVDFAQTGTTAADTIRIPNISYYNLKLTNGLKYFSSNVTTIRGDLTADAVVSINGSSPTFSTVNAFGNVSFLNNSQFEPLPSGDGARITLAMNGTGTQTITGNATNRILLFRLQRDTITSNGNIVLAGNMDLGNAAGGGLRLNQGAATSTVLNMNFGTILSIIGGAVVTPTSNGKINTAAGIINITKTSGNSNAGVLRFVSGSFLVGLGVDFGPAFTRDSITIADNIGVEGLGLNKGKIIVSPGAVLTVTDGPLLSGGHIIGGSAASFVEGKLRRSGLFTPPDNKFPVGQGDKYAPVDIDLVAGDHTVEYFFRGYGNYTVDPATLATYPGYNISRNEYWIITQNSVPPANPAITFYYNDANSGVLNPPQLKVAHFDGTDWNDLGGTAGVANTTTNGFVTVTNVSTFSPFTFAARVAGVIPVKLSSFTVQKINSAVKINWTTEQETNSRDFIVERSANGINWDAITTVPARGNSSSRINYGTIDLNPLKGMNFYRLRQRSIDNSEEYSLTRSVLFNSSYNVLVTPNPANDLINIYLDNDSREVSIQMIDGSGKVIRTLHTSQPYIQLNTAALVRGLYYIKLVDEKNVSVSKILLQ